MSVEGVQVLLVEDDPDCAEVLSEALRCGGCEVDVARNAAEVDLCLRRRTPDVVLMDGTLEDGDGLELTRELKQKALAKTPVLLTTGRTLPEVAARARAAGIARVLVKPIDLVVLLDAIEAALPRRGLAANAP